jgi:dsDNA-specific endonuclease/ATPase MutS2
MEPWNDRQGGADEGPDPPAEGAGPRNSGEPDDAVRIPIEAELDLHPFLPRDVAAVVADYLEEARNAGFASVRIVHGRGTGTQREIVRAVLARTPFVISYRDAPPGSGGWGATFAELAPP